MLASGADEWLWRGRGWRTGGECRDGSRCGRVGRLRPRFGELYFCGESGKNGRAWGRCREVAQVSGCGVEEVGEADASVEMAAGADALGGFVRGLARYIFVGRVACMCLCVPHAGKWRR